MNNILSTKKLMRAIYTMMFVALFLPFVSHAQATPPIEVSFQNTPLFNEANFLPGNMVTRFFTVKNNTGGSWPVYIESIDETDATALASKVDFVVRTLTHVYFDGTLREFFDSGLIELATLTGGQEEKFYVDAEFQKDSGNAYMRSEVGFDLRVGFFNGQDVEDEDDEGGTDDGGGSPPGGGSPATQFVSFSSGGGGSNGPVSTSDNLVITNEGVSGINTDLGTAIATWDTNINSTSYVVYGPSENTYSLSLDDPKFGYPSSSSENSSLVTYHAVQLSGLSAGQEYKIRVVSRRNTGGQPTISGEFRFRLPIAGAEGGAITLIPDGFGGDIDQGVEEGTSRPISQGSGGAGDGDSSGQSTTTDETKGSSQLAALAGLPTWVLDNLVCVTISILIFVVIVILVSVLSRLFGGDSNSVNSRRTQLLIGTIISAITLIIVMILKEWCVFWPLLVLLIISAMFSLIRR